MRQLPLGVRLRDRAVFDSFIVGDNAEAVDHLRSVAQGTRHGVTWLHGLPEAGRTHLLQATCVAAAAPGGAGYVPLADFSHGDRSVLEGWSEASVLCLDDLDRIAGRPDWEASLFRLHREFEERTASLVIAAAQAPTEIAWSLADLGSRFAAATVLRVRELDENQRLDALRMRARLRGVELPDETLHYLRLRVPRDMRTLNAVLDHLDDAALEQQRRLTVPFVRKVLGDPPV